MAKRIITQLIITCLAFILLQFANKYGEVFFITMLSLPILVLFLAILNYFAGKKTTNKSRLSFSVIFHIIFIGIPLTLFLLCIAGTNGRCLFDIFSIGSNFYQMVRGPGTIALIFVIFALPFLLFFLLISDKIMVKFIAQDPKLNNADLEKIDKTKLRKVGKLLNNFILTFLVLFLLQFFL